MDTDNQKKDKSNLEKQEYKKLAKIARDLRISVMTMLKSAGSGHAAGPLGLADIFSYLYFHGLRHNPDLSLREQQDYLLVSNGHIAPIWYATLAKAGYFAEKELLQLRKFRSFLEGHPKLGIPGITNSSGPLGHGQGQAIGFAMAQKNSQQITVEISDQSVMSQSAESRDKSKSSKTTKFDPGIHNWSAKQSQAPFSKSISDRVVLICSDGEQQEGANWESLLLARKYKLNNLTYILDWNNVQIDGHVEDIMPLDGVIESYFSLGWNVVEIDAHNFEEIDSAYQQTAPENTDAPNLIVANSIAGKGVSFMENSYKFHDWSGTPEQAEQAIAELQAIDLNELEK